jgi:HSP20 family molecular chaperone IbpA
MFTSTVFEHTIRDILGEKRESVVTHSIATEDGTTLFVSVPGVSKEQINIVYDDRSVHISLEEKNDDFSFTKPFKISRLVPDGLDIEKADASCRDGVLKLHFPKASPAEKKARKLEVK